MAIAYSHAWLNDDATIDVDNGTTLTAARALSLTVGSTTYMQNASEAYTGNASGAAAADDQNNGDRGARLGSSGDVAERGIEVGTGATLTGSTVNLYASVIKMEVDSNARATAFTPILVGYEQAYANSNVDAYSDAYVRVHGAGTTITGANGVDIRAAQGTTQLLTSRGGKVLAVALISRSDSASRAPTRPSPTSSSTRAPR